MRTSGYAWRRSRARAGLVALLTAMSALVVLALAGTLAYLDVSSTAGVRDAITGSPPAARVLQVQTRVATDPDAQRAAATAVITDLLPGDAILWSSTRTPPMPLVGSEERAILLVDDAIAEHATLSAGGWPGAPNETAVHAGAAQTLGIAVGDVIGISAEETGAELTVVGLWLPDDPDDTHWAGDPTLTDGTDPLEIDAYGPWVVTAQTLEPLAVTPFVRWVVTPGAELTPEALDAWLRDLPRVPDALDEAGLTVRGVTTSGTLTTTLADAREGLASVRASSAIPLLVVALVSLVALWQITRLLGAIRERETLVLLSRGAAPSQIAGFGAAEAAVIACGALIGGAAVVAGFFGRAGFDLGTTVAVAVAVALAVLVVMTTAVARAALTGLHPEGESGRATNALAGSALVLVTALAAFALWRFTRNGSPLVPGTRQIDLVAVGAPALALIAVALVTVTAAGPLTRGLAALMSARPGFSPVTELRQSSRRITVNAVPVVLVVLAAAIATIASGYAGTWQALRSASAQVSVGADARVETAGGIVTARPRGVSEVLAAAGVGADATGVLQGAVRVDETVGQLTALPMTDIGVSSAPGELLDPVTRLLTPATDPLPGLELPRDATTLALGVTAAADGQDDVHRQRTVAVRVWLLQGSELIRLDLGSTRVVAGDQIDRDEETGEMLVVEDPARGRPVSAQLETPVPPGTWRVVAVDTLMEASHNPTSWTVSVDSVSADGTDLLGPSDLVWDPAVLPTPAAGEPFTSEGTMAFSGSFAGDLTSGTFPQLISPSVQRFMPSSDAPLTLPVVTTGGWDDQIRPDGTDVQIGTIPVRVEQVGTMPVVPGNPDAAAALADLGSVQNTLLRSSPEVPSITQVWVDGGDRGPADLAEALREALPPRTEVVATGEGVTDTVAAPARTVYWIAAGCALLLALPAIVAVAMTQAAGRRGEVVVLRAVGVGAAQQGRSRTRELLGLELGAVVAGVLAGWLLSAVIMVPLIRSTAPQVSGAVPLRLTFDWLPGVAVITTVGLVVAAVALWYGARVRAQARDTTWREEIR
ncbi:FtsX-like permease family protein [Pseudactinotalea suaedae]|uniref:FtsX-like permease family protein n=1 Tax=Pseudactinotalea suaedae TaxID=1524924 RepID=UPI0012E18E6B|nr:FtsX-like permease family protein [Pseudactinotalea suaedae]